MSEAAQSSSAPAALSPRDREMLEFESRWWRTPGAKELAIREQFGFSPARYYQVLGAIIDSPIALAGDPLLVSRLRRLRDARRAARSPRASGDS